MNKKPSFSLYKIASAVLPALALVIAVGYLLAMRNDFEYDISHFAYGSTAFWLFTAAAVLSLVIAAVLALFSGKKLTVSAIPAPSPISLFGAILSIIVSVGVFITELKTCMTDIEIARETVGKVTVMPIMQLVGCVLILFVGLAIALYCVESLRGKTLHRIASILAPISINLTMFARYFDFDQPLNGPVRNITTVIACASLLFLLSEARLAFGISTSRITSAFYIFSCAAAASVGLGFSLGGILYKIADPMPADPNESFMRLGLYAAIGLIAIDRLLAFPKIVEPVNEGNETKNEK